MKVPWVEAVNGLIMPSLNWDKTYFTTLVAIAGTTISPYLLFWQAAQEAEDVRMKPKRQPLLKSPRQALPAFARIRADTMVGMAFSNLIAVAIMITTAATLHSQGVTNIETSGQAAEALRPRSRLSTGAPLLNGIVAVPLIVMVMLMTTRRPVMGKFTIGGWLTRPRLDHGDRHARVRGRNVRGLASVAARARIRSDRRGHSPATDPRSPPTTPSWPC